MSSFPINPSDGQIVEIGGVKYRFAAKEKCWVTIDGIDLPGVATSTTDGIMLKEDYVKVVGLLLPPPKSTLTAQDCGIVFDKGRVALRCTDDSLNITTSPTVLGINSSDSLPWKLHENTYGIDFMLNIDRLLADVDAAGRLRYKKTKGSPGLQGDVGIPGIDRLDTGPQGAQGEAGQNAPFPGSLAVEDVAFVQSDPKNNRAVVDVSVETISPDENYLVVTRALIGNPNACPQLVRPKKINSPWLIITDMPPQACFFPSTCPGKTCGVKLYYLDITGVVQAIQDRYRQLVYELKAAKEAAATGWMKTMIAVFNEQKNAICCALENCQSRNRNQDFRDKIDEARIQASQRNMKLVVKGPDDTLPHIEMDPGKECSNPDGTLDIVTVACPTWGMGQSNYYCTSPDGYSPVPLSQIAAMDLPNGGVPAWPNAPVPFNQLLTLDRGLYRARTTDVAPVSILDLHSRQVQLVHSSGAGSASLGRIVDYTDVINQLGGVNYALNPSRPEWPQFHAIMNADPENHLPTVFHHDGGWIATFINYDQAYSPVPPNNRPVNGASAVLIEAVANCPCTIEVILYARKHANQEFNEGIGVRIDGLPAGDLQLEGTKCCYNIRSDWDWFSGQYQVTAKQPDGTIKTMPVSVVGNVSGIHQDGFYKLEDAQAAYLGLRQSFYHPGGSLWLWIKDIPVDDNSGSITVQITRLDCLEPSGTEEGSEGGLIETCDMAASQVDWYERGWRIEECCGAYLTYGGQKWLVVKRSIGIDMSCGGGESPNTPCLKKFIDGGYGHPAVAWPTLDGIEFEGKPTSGSVVFGWDQTLSDAFIAQIKAGGVLKKIGNAEDIQLILFPQSGSPVPPPVPTTVRRLSIGSGGGHTIAIDAALESFGWGDNANGEIGDGTLNNRSTSVAVLGPEFVDAARGSAFSLGLADDGQVWGWGYGGEGQLGGGTTPSNVTSPTAVVGSHIFVGIAAGYMHSAALKQDGSAWCWGNGVFGQLGNNASGFGADRSSPISVVGAHSFNQICSGGFFTAAKKADGSAWVWGCLQGGSGVGAVSSPIMVAGHVFSAISAGIVHIAALKSDGSAWAWGTNSYGRLGDGTTTYRSTPISVVGGHSFTQISAGGVSTYGLKADGTLWSWGWNGSGELGTGSIVNYSSPVSVVGSHSFAFVAASQEQCFAMKADGSIWGWGRNNGGQVGDGTIIDRSSPVLVTTLA